MPDQVWVLGLDGATWTLLQPWIDAGALPTLAYLQKNGAWGPLRSSLQFLTPVAWTTFLTGLNPGKHGIFDFTRRTPGSYQPTLVNAASRTGRSLWRILSDANKRVGVVNVPMTYPPEPVNGFLVSGLDTPGLNARYTWPPAFKEKVQDLHFIAVGTIGKSHQRYLQETLAGVDKRFALFRRTQTMTPLDFYMGVVMETDAIQHCSWHLLSRPEHPQHDAILQVYQRIDAHLAEMLARMPDDVTLIIMSDHGAGPIARIIYLDRWLARQGWLHWRSGHGRQTLQRGAQRAFHLAQRFLPAGVKGRLKRFSRTQAAMDALLTQSAIDWPRTAAYTAGNLGAINLNIRGRDPEGVLAPEQVDEFIDALTQALHALRDPETGQPMVARVMRRQEVYTGPMLARAPDLLIRWVDDKYLAVKDYDADPHGPVFGDRLKFGRHGAAYALDQTGTHVMDGIVLMFGRNVRSGVHLSRANLLDLAPTILHLLSVPIPKNMDGSPLLGAFTAKIAQKRVIFDENSPKTPFFDENLTLDEQKQLRERLQSLGYIAD